MASACVASTLVGTANVSLGFAKLSTAGLGQSHSFPARVGSLCLQTWMQMWKVESSRAALAGSDLSHLHPAHLVSFGYEAH